jgi:hypothetical protein
MIYDNDPELDALHHAAWNTPEGQALCNTRGDETREELQRLVAAQDATPEWKAFKAARAARAATTTSTGI